MMQPRFVANIIREKWDDRDDIGTNQPYLLGGLEHVGL
jgi:hypothetical protein